MADLQAVDAREIVHVLRAVKAGFPDPTDRLNSLALEYCAWNQLIGEADERAVITEAGEKFLGSVGQLYPVADHPHTDPGDGRTECDRCGKFVWRVTHSCKGIPVTKAARARWAEKHDGGQP